MKIIRLSEFSKEEETYFERMNFKVVEHKEILDYDLFLTKTTWFYQIAMKRKDLNFVDPSFQYKKFKPLSKIKDMKYFLAECKNVIDEWKTKYGEIYFGSYNGKKTEAYAKLLKMMGFNIVPERVLSFDVYKIV